jgi:hypothetical protein
MSDRLRRPSAHPMEASANSSVPASVSGCEQDEEDDDGDSSIMLYCPLAPSEDSEVELPTSNVMSVFDDGETLEFEQPACPLSFAEAGGQLTPPRSSHSPLSAEPAQQQELANAQSPDAREEPCATDGSTHGRER